MIEPLARLKFAELEQWLSSRQSAQSTLGAVEGTLEIDGRELLRLLLQEHIHRRGSVDFGDAIAVRDACGTTINYSCKRVDTRTIITMVGAIDIARTGYYSPKSEAIHPIDQQLQLPRRCYSYEVQRRTVKMAVQGPFDEAIEMVRESMGIDLPKRSAEELLVDAGVDFDRFYSNRDVEQCAFDDPIIVAAVDCKGIPMVKSELVDASGKVRRGKGQKAQKKKMATVAAVFTQQPYIRTPQEVVDSLFRTAQEPKPSAHKPRCNNKRVWASLTSGKDVFIDDVVKEVMRRNRNRNKFLVVVTDGERALQQKISRTMKNATLILDLVHALEKIWKAAYVFHEEGSTDAQLFVKNRALSILNGKVGQVVKGLRAMVTKRKLTGSKRDVLIGVSNYLYRNRSRMKYHLYLQKGLPIASGSVEGACKNLIKDRMERSGMRWTQRTEAMVKMRATYLSGDFDDYWKFHVEQEQNRLYSVKWNQVDAK